ncbi:MAG TPA: dicarboxylate/amino acid:cation symporter [Acidobacteriota bacterium]|nr:dicarboxylate/amino acid:cation symporter [Acidobacteriota bacterium]
MAAKKPWYRQLHWQILIGMVLGVIFGVFGALNGLHGFIEDWIAPWGRIFLNLLLLIAIPLVLTSLITGVASLSDVNRLSRLGGKTIVLYMATTAVAITIGLGLANIMRPGDYVPTELAETLQARYQAETGEREATAALTREEGPLQPLVDIVPGNFFSSASSNRNMLQMVFVALLVGIVLIQLKTEHTEVVYHFFEGMNQVIIKMVDLIMYIAPLGVFALLADTIVRVGEDPDQIIELLGALSYYCIAVVLGLILHVLIVYTSLINFLTPMPLRKFLAAITPVQLVAFSTSSSGATLPVTMERCQDELGVSEEVSSFVLPLGATINMDGTALYQSVAALFIAQALGLELGFVAQLTIVFTALLASIGSAAVPGAGIIMLVIILNAIGVPAAGIALILGVDRILDMCRTATNVTGDCTVATLIAHSEGEKLKVD